MDTNGETSTGKNTNDTKRSVTLNYEPQILACKSVPRHTFFKVVVIGLLTYIAIKLAEIGAALQVTGVFG